jgi:hypothetical protein
VYRLDIGENNPQLAGKLFNYIFFRLHGQKLSTCREEQTVPAPTGRGRPKRPLPTTAEVAEAQDRVRKAHKWVIDHFQESIADRQLWVELELENPESPIYGKSLEWAERKWQAMLLDLARAKPVQNFPLRFDDIKPGYNPPLIC